MLKGVLQSQRHGGQQQERSHPRVPGQGRDGSPDKANSTGKDQKARTLLFVIGGRSA
jgi:hypothetical protein